MFLWSSFSPEPVVHLQSHASMRRRRLTRRTRKRNPLLRMSKMNLLTRKTKMRTRMRRRTRMRPSWLLQLPAPPLEQQVWRINQNVTKVTAKHPLISIDIVVIKDHLAWSSLIFLSIVHRSLISRSNRAFV